MNSKRVQRLRSIKFRVALLVAAFFLLSFFFLSPPPDLVDESKAYKNSQAKNFSKLDDTTEKYLDVEHHKVIDEIKSRIEAQDSWFHYKFILTGGMIALLLGQIGFGQFGGRKESSHINHGKWLKEILTSESAYLILALSCVVGFIIDMHIRSQNYSIQQLGMWIAYYVEPSYVTPKDLGSGFLPWEQSLRTLTGMHLNTFYRFAYSLHLHYMTIFIYLLFTLLLQSVCLGFSDEKNEGQRLAVVAGYLFVQLSALAFTVVAHAVPSNVMLRIIPFEGFADGVWSTAYYSIPLLFLTALHIPYLLLMRNRKDKKSPPEQPARRH